MKLKINKKFVSKVLDKIEKWPSFSVLKSRDLSRTPRFWAWSPWLNFAARDKSREPKSPWFWEISAKNEKIPYFCPKSYNFCQKNIKNSHSNLQTKTFSKKVRDFSEILRSFACDFRDFGGVFLFVIFVIFWLKSRDFQEKSFGNTDLGTIWAKPAHEKKYFKN